MGIILSEIKKRRCELGVSIDEISDITGFSEEVISRFESGEIGPNDTRFIPIVGAYSHYFIININELVKGEKKQGTFELIGSKILYGLNIAPNGVLVVLSLLILVLYAKLDKSFDSTKRYSIELKNF